MVNWIVLYRTDYLHKNGFDVKTQQTNQQFNKTSVICLHIVEWRNSSISNSI